MYMIASGIPMIVRQSRTTTSGLLYRCGRIRLTTPDSPFCLVHLTFCRSAASGVKIVPHSRDAFPPLIGCSGVLDGLTIECPPDVPPPPVSLDSRGVARGRLCAESSR